MDALTAGDIIGGVLGALGLAGGSIGFLRGSRAGRQADAATALATAAATRSATALELANEISERSILTPSVEWRLGHLKGSKHILENTGDATAFGAAVCDATGSSFIRPDNDIASDVRPGEGLAFMALHHWGPSPRYRLTWEEGDPRRLEVQEQDVHSRG